MKKTLGTEYEKAEPEISFKESWKRQEEARFSPERKRDAARLLRKMKGKEKELALKYAAMLEAESRADERQSEAIRAYLNQPSNLPDYDADQ